MIRTPLFCALLFGACDLEGGTYAPDVEVAP